MPLTTTEDMTKRTLFDTEEQARSVAATAAQTWPEHQWKWGWIEYLKTRFWYVRTPIADDGFRLYIREN